MKKQLGMIAILGISSLFINLASAAEAGLTTGSPNGVYYAMGKDIQKTCSATVPLQVYESAGSVSNVERVLGDKRYQYGIVQQDALLYKALTDQKAKDKIKIIMPLHNDTIHLIATASSGIRSLADLKGKRVIIGADGSGNWVTANLIQAKTDIDWQAIEVSPDQGITQLLLGQADAMFYVIGKGGKLLTSLGSAAKGKLKLVPMNNPQLDSFYIPTTIPDGTYDWAPTPVHTYAVKNVLVTFDFKTQYQAEIGALTSCIVKNLNSLQEGAGVSNWRDVEPADYKLVKWPVHPAAERILNQRR